MNGRDRARTSVGQALESLERRLLLAGVDVYAMLPDGPAAADTAAPAMAEAYTKTNDGWDGSGRGSITLGYYFGTATPDLTVSRQRAILLAAMQEWSRYVWITWTQKSSPGQDKTIDFKFSNTSPEGNFDNAGGTLAIAYSPPPQTSESLAGDLFFDEHERWTSDGSGTDLFSVALHEIGHSLGLDHSADGDAVMYPYYNEVTMLAADDIAGIRSIYASTTNLAPDLYEIDDTPAEATPLAVNGPTQTHRISWPSDVDWVSFIIPERSNVTISALAPSGDPELWLYGPDSSTTLVAHDDNGAGGLSARIARSADGALEAGTYYVKVAEHGANARVPSYTLGVAASAAGDVYEPDNTTDQAAPLWADTAQTHSIHVADDVDWTSFLLTDRSDVTLQAAAQEGSMDLALYSADDLVNPIAQGSGANVTLTSAGAALYPGVYYVRAASDGRVDEYTLSLGATVLADTAPVLDSAAALQLAAVDEDDAAGSGTLIADLIASAGGNPITDADIGAREGIAVIAADTTEGAWSFSIDDGTTWTALGEPTDASARLLRDSDLIRFEPALDFNGTLADLLTFRAWDQTHGLPSQTADTTTNGGATAFSAETATADIAVDPVNDAPVAAEQSVTLDEEGLVEIQLTATDVETAAENLTYAITTEPVHGTLAPLGNGRYSYQAEAGYNGPDSFGFAATDDGDPAGSHAAPGDLTSEAATVMLEVGYQMPLANGVAARYADSDGRLVTMLLRGGHGTLYFARHGASDLARLSLEDTGTASTLVITTAAGARTSVGQINVAGSLGTILARTTDVGGVQVDGTLRYAILGDVAAGSTITIGPAVRSTDTVSLTVDRVDNATLDSETPIRLLSATEWATGGQITAPWITSLLIRGRLANPVLHLDALPGDFAPGLMLGADAAGTSILSARIAGTIAAGEWDLDGNARSIFCAGSAGGWTLDAEGSVTSLIASGPLAGQLSASWFSVVRAGGELTATIAADGQDARGQSIASLTAGAATDASIGVPGGIGSIRAWQWLDGSISADWLRSLLVTGHLAPSLTGDFAPDLTLAGTATPAGAAALSSARISGGTTGTWNLTGNAGVVSVGSADADWSATISGDAISLYAGATLAGQWTSRSLRSLSVLGNADGLTLNVLQAPDPARPAALALGSAYIRGWLMNSSILSASSVGVVTVGGMQQSSVLAGVTDPTDLLGAGGQPDGVLDLPDTGAIDTTVAIQSLLVRGCVQNGARVDSFINSNIAAGRLGSITISYARTDNGEVPFGLEADRITRVVLRSSSATQTRLNLDDAGGSFSQTDLEVRLF